MRLAATWRISRIRTSWLEESLGSPGPAWENQGPEKEGNLPEANDHMAEYGFSSSAQSG